MVYPQEVSNPQQSATHLMDQIKKKSQQSGAGIELGTSVPTGPEPCGFEEGRVFLSMTQNVGATVSHCLGYSLPSLRKEFFGDRRLPEIRAAQPSKCKITMSSSHPLPPSSSLPQQVHYPSPKCMWSTRLTIPMQGCL